jgi:hypothetical protein
MLLHLPGSKERKTQRFKSRQGLTRLQEIDFSRSILVITLVHTCRNIFTATTAELTKEKLNQAANCFQYRFGVLD